MIELDIGRDWWDYYADDDISSVELLEKCVDDMKNRLRQMQGISRKFTPGPEMPLNVIVVDEMGYLAAYLTDRKLQDRAKTAISAILAKGRAPGYALVVPLSIAWAIRYLRSFRWVLGSGDSCVLMKLKHTTDCVNGQVVIRGE